jgi:hypothetical protein
MGKEHGCTTATGIAGVWPNTAVEGGTTVLSGGGVYTIRYFRKAPLDPPLPEETDIIIFLFLSSASAMTFISLS